MRRMKSFICGLFTLLLFCMAFPYLSSEASSDLSKNVTSEYKEQKTIQGWVKKGKYQYYRLKNGKVCKKAWVKIGKYYYSFDTKGRMRKGVVKLNSDYSGYFSFKTGRFIYNAMDLKVAEVYSEYALAVNEQGAAFSVPFKNVKWVDKEGRKVKKEEIRENGEIRVCFKGEILESSPAQFVKIVKVRVR